jgi:hypothetical protein
LACPSEFEIAGVRLQLISIGIHPEAYTIQYTVLDGI